MPTVAAGQEYRFELPTLPITNPAPSEPLTYCATQPGGWTVEFTADEIVVTVPGSEAPGSYEVKLCVGNCAAACETETHCVTSTFIIPDGNLQPCDVTIDGPTDQLVATWQTGNATPVLTASVSGCSDGVWSIASPSNSNPADIEPDFDRFVIDPVSGEVDFAPGHGDFNNPTDFGGTWNGGGYTGGNNTYFVTVRYDCSDGLGCFDLRRVFVTVDGVNGGGGGSGDIQLFDSLSAPNVVACGASAGAGTNLTAAVSGNTGAPTFSILIGDCRFNINASTGVVTNEMSSAYPPIGNQDVLLPNGTKYSDWNWPFDLPGDPVKQPFVYTGVLPQRFVDLGKATNGNGLSMATAFNALPTGNIGGFEWIFKDGVYSPTAIMTTASRNTTASSWAVLRPETPGGVVCSNGRSLPFVKTSQNAEAFRRLIIQGFDVTGYEQFILGTRGCKDILLHNNKYTPAGALSNFYHFLYFGYRSVDGDNERCERVVASYNVGGAAATRTGAFLGNRSLASSTNDGLRDYIYYGNYLEPGGEWTHGCVISPDGGGNGLIFSNTLTGRFQGTPMTFGNYGARGHDNVALRNNIFVHEGGGSGGNGAIGFWGSGAQVASAVTADGSNTGWGASMIETPHGASPPISAAALGDFRNPQLDANSRAQALAERCSGSDPTNLPRLVGIDGRFQSCCGPMDRGAYQYGPLPGAAGSDITADCSGYQVQVQVQVDGETLTMDAVIPVNC